MNRYCRISLTYKGQTVIECQLQAHSLVLLLSAHYCFGILIATWNNNLLASNLRQVTLNLTRGLIIKLKTIYKWRNKHMAICLIIKPGVQLRVYFPYKLVNVHTQISLIFCRLLSCTVISLQSNCWESTYQSIHGVLQQSEDSESLCMQHNVCHHSIYVYSN